MQSVNDKKFELTLVICFLAIAAFRIFKDGFDDCGGGLGFGQAGGKPEIQPGVEDRRWPEKNIDTYFGINF